MRRCLSIRFAGWALALLAAPAEAGAPAETEAPPPTRCTQAAIADVVLAAPVPIDEIRVVVASGSPETGAAQVTVEVSDGGDRVVYLRGGSRALSFSPALTSRAFRVSLLPDFAAARDACVDRIELRRGGAPVATIVP
jgi:hypothetical protein